MRIILMEMKIVFFVILVLPGLAHAAWTKSTLSQLCKGEMFESSNKKATVWTRGTDTVALCTFEKTETGQTVRANEAFEVKAHFGNRDLTIASEPEVGANPIQMEFNGDVVKILRFQSQDGPAVYSQTISCATKCELSKESCVLKPNPKANQIMQKIADEMLKAKLPSGKLKIWQKYFYDGKNLAEGQIVLSEAMLGDQRAERLALDAPGADAGLSESNGETKLNIERIQKFCRTRDH